MTDKVRTVNVGPGDGPLQVNLPGSLKCPFQALVITMNDDGTLGICAFSSFGPVEAEDMNHTIDRMPTGQRILELGVTGDAYVKRIWDHGDEGLRQRAAKLLNDGERHATPPQ